MKNSFYLTAVCLGGGAFMCWLWFNTVEAWLAAAAAVGVGFMLGKLKVLG